MKKVLLVGCGYMGIEYAKVLVGLDYNFITIGKGEYGVKKFKELFPKNNVISGGLAQYISEHNPIPDAAIVAVNVEFLKETTALLINWGVKNILLEKPGGIDIHEINELSDLAAKMKVNVFLAYNRRFYASTLFAKKQILEDGGITSFCFEFTEWSHVIEKLDKPLDVKDSWFLSNSSHVVDLAFYLGGEPEKMSCYLAGKGDLEWHKRASRFAGAGITKNDVLFSYQANWNAPGRWVVEMLTSKRRFLFKPMETLQSQKIGSILMENVEIDDNLDKIYKPGLFLETKCFLEGDFKEFSNIHQQKYLVERYYFPMINSII